MATTSPSMGLKIWNLLGDPYDHTQLADNWAKVDQHDHSEGKGTQIPTGGLADGAVSASKLGSASVTDDKIYKAAIRGRVTAEGVVELGLGFTVAKTGTGLYTITFTPALSTPPIVIGAVFNASGIVTTTLTSTTEAKVTVKNLSGTAENQSFSFIAYPS